MYEIINTLIKEIDLRGIPVHYNREIVSFRKHDGQVISLVDNKGNHYAFENYIINMDAALFRSKILQRKTYSPQMMRNMKWSMGFLTFYLGIDVELPQLNMHNYFIGKDDKDKNMKSFRSDVIPDNPYFYVNVCSKMNEKAAPEGSEALMFVVPVPNLINRKNWDDKQQIVDSIIKEFGDRIGLDLSSHIVTQHIMTPVDWSDQFNLYAGAGLGLNHSMWQTGYFRPENKDEVYENLYYTGASTVPGIGLPMAIISSRLTTERLINNH